MHYFNDTNPAPTKRRWVKPALAVAALAVVFAAGAGTTSARTVEVEKRVEVPGPERTITQTVEKQVTPPACPEALDYAEQIVASAGRATGYMSDAMGATARFDSAGIRAASGKIDGETTTVKGLTPKYQAAKASCISK